MLFKTGAAAPERAHASRTVRHGLLWAGTAMLLPLTCVAAAAQAPAPPTNTAFAPPDTPLILTRTLYRPLAGGAQVVATRRYKVRFSSEGDGFRLDGELIDVVVTTPPELARFAAIERQRPDVALFPTRLDAQGMIRSRPVQAVDTATRQNARQALDNLIRDAAATPAEKQALASAAQVIVAAAEGGTTWPVYLFNPGAQEHLERRTVTLADGSQSQIEVLVRATGLMASGLPQRIERTVTTRLAGTQRTTREVWTIGS